MAKRLDYQISYDELKIVFFSVLAKLCHKPYITQDFTLGDLGIDNELTFCTELEFAMKKYLNRYFCNGFDFRQWFHTWNDKTPVGEMLNRLAWQYSVVVPEKSVLECYRATRAAIDNKIVAQYKGQKKRQKVTDIPNTEYITINKDGIFVGGKPATTYRGVKMGSVSWECENFYAIQARYPNVMEIHVLSSKTCGVYAKAGNPSAETGPNAWCRVKFTSGHIGSWVLCNKFESGNDFCAENCLYVCMAELDLGKDFRNAVFGANLFDALKTSDLSVFVNNPLQINGYEIVVRKLAETQQNKR